MQEKLNTSRSGGPGPSCHSNAAPALTHKRDASTKPKTLPVSPTSKRVITKTSVKRREAMKVLANR